MIFILRDCGSWFDNYENASSSEVVYSAVKSISGVDNVYGEYITSYFYYSSYKAGTESDTNGFSESSPG